MLTPYQPQICRFLPGLPGSGLFFGGGGGGGGGDGDPHWANVVLLTGFEGADGSTLLRDESNSKHVLTANGNAQVDTAEKKFEASALLLDGTGDYVSCPDSADWAFGAGQFTIDMQVRFATVASTQALIAHYNNTGNQRSLLLHFRGADATKVLRLVWYATDQVAKLFDFAWTPTVGQWYHIAVDRDASKMRMYVDGVMVASVADTTTLHDSTEPLLIGAVNSSGITQFLNGGVDELRITKGVARYASDAGFTPPSAIFPRHDPDWASVVLLSGFEGADGSTVFEDESDTPHALTANGNARIGTANFKYGVSSLLVDGTGDFLAAPDSEDWNFGAGQFTVEGWVRWFSDPASNQALIAHWRTSPASKSWQISYNSVDNQLRFLISTDGSTTTAHVTAAFTPTLGTWYHIAVDFDGTTYRLYLDGAVVGSSTTLVTLFDSAPQMTLGAQEDGFGFDGRLDEVRVTKGVARYKGAFPVPPRAFPRS